MKIEIKKFEDLTNKDLYSILRLRSEVFVVEQNCVYQDMDNKDQKAIHVLGYSNKQLVAYTRLFKKGEYFNNASIGRVVVSKENRGKELGKRIMIKSEKFIKETFKKERFIELSAQKYLLKFYNNLGYNKKGREYLEDNIPHMKMEKKIN